MRFCRAYCHTTAPSLLSHSHLTPYQNVVEQTDLLTDGAEQPCCGLKMDLVVSLREKVCLHPDLRHCDS